MNQYLQQAAQSKPVLVPLKTITVEEIATDFKATNALFIPNPKNCGYDYIWFENAQGQVIKIKIGTKAAPLVASLDDTAKMRYCVTKLIVYVNTEDRSGAALERPVFTFGPAGTLRPTTKVSIGDLFGKQEVMQAGK